MVRILLINLDEATKSFILQIFSLGEYEFTSVTSHKKAWEELGQGKFSIIILGHRLCRTGALEFIKKMPKKHSLPIIVISRHPDIKDAIECIRRGASDFLVTPLKPLEIKKAIIKALESRKVLLENIRLKKAFMENRFSGIIGTSPAIQKVREQILQVAPTKSTVLVTGESGTGKELIAESIYNLSPRVGKPFIKINCGALSESLLESELFGHEKGSFTGALNQRKGRFELAHRGTIFLDEIGEMSLAMQVKLLRVLETGEFERVGGEKTIKVDVRVIAATNRDLEEEVRAGRFRADLYYRLNVFIIEMPPLRERSEDILLLAHYFLQCFSRENAKEILGFSPEVEKLFLSYTWPGNVRELKHIVERAVIVSKTPYIQSEDLPSKFRISPDSVTSITLPIGLTMKEIEQEVIRKTLLYTKGNKQAAAKMLGISLATLYRRLS